MRTVLFNHIAVGELSVNFIKGPTAEIKVKAAFVNTENGKTYGWTEGAPWSKETIERLAELRHCMERDLAAVHFADAAEGSPGTSIAGGSMADAPKGLGERLGSTGGGSGEEVPQG
jgi:hypothetical protein